MTGLPLSLIYTVYVSTHSFCDAIIVKIGLCYKNTLNQDSLDEGNYLDCAIGRFFSRLLVGDYSNNLPH